MMSNFYSCITNDSSTLYGDDSGVTELQITYKYEIYTTASTVNIEEAVEKVQSAMLHSVAEHSGLADCGVEDVWRRKLSDDSMGSSTAKEGPNGKLAIQTRRGRDNNSIHRRLRTGGRGSTSIVALSSSPTDTPTDLLCYVDAVELANTRVEDIFDPNNAEVEDGMTGMVVMAEEEEEEEEEEIPANQVENTEGGNDQLNANTIGLPSSVTRIDGKVVSALDATPRSITLRNEGGTGGGTAFNYISTQSLPHEQSSGNLWHTSYNPLRPQPKLSQLLSTRTNNIVTESNADAENTSLPVVDHSELKETRNTNKKCTVIQGQMRIYTSSKDPSFENLEDRILDTLIQDVNNKNLGLEGDNLVLDVRMYNPDVPDPIEVSPGYMQAIKGPLNDDASSNASFEFTTQMGILVSLGCLFLALIVLFVHTSKPRRRSEKDAKCEAQKTYHDNEVEMDIHDHNSRVVKSKDCNDDFSVGKYSVRTAGIDDQILQSSSFWGLFAARPRADTPHSEVEVDIEPSVYDCDAPDTPARSTGVSTRGSGSGKKRTPERRRHDDLYSEDYSIEAPPYVEKKKIEPTYFVGNVANQGDRIILNSQGGGRNLDDDHESKTVFSKTFGKFFAKRNRSNDSSNVDNTCTVQEIHEIYSADADDRVSRKPTPSPDRTIEPFTPSPERTVKPKPKTPTRSPMRPIGFYKSPSELSATRSPRSELGGSPARGKKKSIPDMVEVSSESQHEVAKPDPICDSSEVQQCAPDVWGDDGSLQSSMVPANGVMCTGGAIPDCFVSNSWNPFSWAYDD